MSVWKLPDLERLKVTRNAPQKSERIETGQSIFPFEFQQSRLLLCTTSIPNVMSRFYYTPSLSYNQSPYFSKHFGRGSPG
jgi:hypothetical protein